MISFIIPTLNEEKVIKKTLESLLVYSGEKEIIISDGNSRDTTVAIAKQYTDKVVVYTGKTRQTIGGGRNMGAQIAIGDFLVFTDADVVIPDINKFFEKAFTYFKQDQKLLAITVKYKVFPEMSVLGDKIVFMLGNFFFLLLNNVFKFGTTGGEFIMVRTESFQHIGGFNEMIALSEDADLFQRLAKIGKTRYKGELFIYHTGRRVHKVGAVKIIFQWVFGWIALTFFKKSLVEEWKEVR